jgi:CelD/BcsL family acetyltransferase involved in cellulose biosynthesis
MIYKDSLLNSSNLFPRSDWESAELKTLPLEPTKTTMDQDGIPTQEPSSKHVRTVMTSGNAMRVDIHPFSELPAAIFSDWEEWIADRAEIQSPFCHPGFSRAVDQAMGNVEVAVAYSEGLPSAVLPFQRLNRRTAIPAGSYLSNFNGWISKSGTGTNLSQLIEASDVRSFRFHALPMEDIPTMRFCGSRRTVVYADVSKGFQAYVERKKANGSNVVAKLAQKERKISREIGELRLEVGFSEEAFARLLEWKQQACSKRNVRNILASKGYAEVLARLPRIESPHFRHHFVRLMAGNQLVAVHLGMICHRRMAAWFPAFNPDFGQYSPGLLLLLQLVRNCEHWNVDRIDFGSGEFYFKDRFKTGESTMLEGIVDKSFTSSLLYNCWLKSRDFVKSTELRPLVQRLWNAFR